MLEQLVQSQDQVEMNFKTIYFLDERDVNDTLVQLPTGVVIMIDDNTILMTEKDFDIFKDQFVYTRAYVVGDRVLAMKI